MNISPFPTFSTTLVKGLDGRSPHICACRLGESIYSPAEGDHPHQDAARALIDAKNLGDPRNYIGGSDPAWPERVTWVYVGTGWKSQYNAKEETK